MKFDRIRLRNFRPYADADLDLSDGVTVIHGLNGSGKSSLLEACFFALYGSKALEGTLEEVVTNGAEETEIDLWFTHDGDDYHVRRRLRASGERTTTAECVLEGAETAVEGARDVRGYVTDLLRMDAEAFVNCAYVRQGEVNELINASPDQRQDVIDDLLQLGRLEEYRERAGEARLGVNDVLSDARGRLAELDDQIAAKEDDDLHATLNALRTELSEVDDDVERFEENRDRARETLESAKSILSEYEEKRERLSDLEERIEAVESTVAEAAEERDDLRERVEETRDRAADRRTDLEDALDATEIDGADEEALAARREELDERESERRDALTDARMEAQARANQASNLEESASDRAERASEKRERAAELESDADEAESDLEARRERLAELGETLATHREAFESAPIEEGEAETHLETRRERLTELRERRADLNAELDAAEDRVSRAEELLDEGKCPECGQPVGGAPHVDSLEDDREAVAALREERDEVDEAVADLEADVERAERLVERETAIDRVEEKRADLRDLLADREESVAETRAEAERLREAADELDADAEERREAAAEKRAEAETKRERVAELEAELERIEERRDRLDRVERLREAVSEAEAEADRLVEKREDLAALNDERRERLAELRDRRDDVREAVDEDRVAEAREDRERAADYLERVEEKLDELSAKRDALQSKIGRVEGDIDRLADLRETRESVAARVEALESLHEEAAALESTYGDLRADLRQRNVETLERLLNETFDLVYANDAYAHLRLDGDYALSVVQKDGDELEPEQLSGGERALFNLSLRCAIYRLLAEGIEGTAPMPPLILDEPTVFLDSGHVSRLVDLVEEMRALGVAQIVIVSHDDELVGAADDLVRVEKDARTNRSSVVRTVPDDVAQLVDGRGDADD